MHAPSFLWTLVRTDFKIRYHGSLGGFIWAILRPLSLFLVLQAVFSYIFTTDPEYRLNLVIGLFIWDFFVEASKAGLTSLAARGHLLTKLKVPPSLIVVASISNALITLAVFVVIITIGLIAAGHAPAPRQMLLFAGYLAQFTGIIIGFSLASSVLFLRYRDLNQLWDLITQVGFFAAPIIYPLGILPEKVHLAMFGWPPTPIIQFSRAVLVDGTVPTARAHAMLAFEVVAALVIGTMIFRRYVRRTMERL